MVTMEKVRTLARRAAVAGSLILAVFLIASCETTQPEADPGPSEPIDEQVEPVEEQPDQEQTAEPESPETTDPAASETDPPDQTDPPPDTEDPPEQDDPPEQADPEETPDPPDAGPPETEPPEAEPPETDPPEEEPDDPESPEQEPTDDDPPEQEPPDQEPTEPDPEEPSNGEGENGETGGQTDPEEPFEVTEETYERTFQEVEEVIGELNRIIQNRDFERWKSYLTEEYIERVSSPDNLATISESPILQRNNITLESLQDYFRWVVVPSRANARLDDLEFLDDNTVHAIMNVGGRPAILYRLEKVDGRWKIGID